MEKMTTHKAKTQFSKLLKRVEAGEEIVIYSGNRPVARLAPLVQEEKPKQRILGMYGKQLFWMSPDFDEPMDFEALSSPDDPLNITVKTRS
jgi:prevent-host-death family protein